MPKPRYDESEDVSRHAAADDECCEEMRRKYGWKLARVEPIESPVFDVDCVFRGKTEFPRPHHDNEKQED